MWFDTLMDGQWNSDKWHSNVHCCTSTILVLTIINKQWFKHTVIYYSSSCDSIIQEFHWHKLPHFHWTQNVYFLPMKSKLLIKYSASFCLGNITNIFFGNSKRLLIMFYFYNSCLNLLFSFWHKNFRNITASGIGAPPPMRLACRKSWIRHCMTTHGNNIAIDTTQPNA